MPSFDPQDRARLNHYASDLRIWFQEWLLEPVQKATGGIIPTALSTLYADMNELENEFGRQLDQSIGIDDRHAPLLKRILLYQRQHLAEKHEEIRLKTTSSEIRDALEAQSEPVRRLMSEEWFQNTRPSRLPRLTDFLTPRDTRSEEHTSELQSRLHLVCRLLLEKKNNDLRLVRPLLGVD